MAILLHQWPLSTRHKCTTLLVALGFDQKVFRSRCEHVLCCGCCFWGGETVANGNIVAWQSVNPTFTSCRLLCLLVSHTNTNNHLQERVRSKRWKNKRGNTQTRVSEQFQWFEPEQEWWFRTIHVHVLKGPYPTDIDRIYHEVSGTRS